MLLGLGESLEWVVGLFAVSCLSSKIGRKFALLTITNTEDASRDSMITTFNTAVSETASEVLGKHR